MDLDIASPSPERRLRPRLWMVFTALGLSASALGVVGLGLVRVYDDQLIRQTESELIAEGTVVAEAFHRELRAPEGDAYGSRRRAEWPFPIPPEGTLLPILPTLSASSPVLPAAQDPPGAPQPPDEAARIAGEALSPLLSRVARSTLAGIRVVDVRGVVVASSGREIGTSFAEREEVAGALAGRPSSVLRRRVSSHLDTPLSSLSRESGVRVSVALPVIDRDRVWGAVLLSRTPMTYAKMFYADRWNLTATGVVLIVVVALGSLGAATFVVRPVRALVRQTEAIAAGDERGFRPIPAPIVEELAALSHALASMARALRERTEYIRSFAANVSHEFKTPLSAIKGAVELLRESEMSEAQRERFLANIDEDAERLTRLVRQLLELARADSMQARGEACDAPAILRAAAERAGQEGTGVDVRVEPCPRRARVPGEVLEAVLTQLISNARQHGGEGARLALTLEWDARAQEISIRVRDDGKGISEANRARIFDAFFTTDRAGGGTGLGLTIARSMLQAFGARLDLAPSDGRGAVFVLTLPAAPDRE